MPIPKALNTAAERLATFLSTLGGVLIILGLPAETGIAPDSIQL
jgi:hypothetical protein